MADQVSRDVGRRLRAVRRQQGLSLEDVEERSGGQWSASAIGAYERGYRTLTVERLRALADFFDVPMSVLLAPAPRRDEADSGKVVINLEALARMGPELAPLSRLARSIQVERNDFNGKMLSIRHADIKNLALLYGTTEEELVARLQKIGVIAAIEDSLEDSVEGEPPPARPSRRTTGKGNGSPKAGGP